MDDVIRTMTGGELIGFTAVVLGTVTGLVLGTVGIVASYWGGARQVEAKARLKRDLLAAGFSADDIERVVQATAGGEPAPTRPAVARRG